MAHPFLINMLTALKGDKNQDRDPLRAVKTLMSKGMGHTAVSTTKSRQ